MRDKVIKFVIGHVDNQVLDFESCHPWRKDARHILQHGLRIDAYTKRIIKEEGIKLPAEEMQSLEAACILHDLGKLKGNQDHNLTSVDMVNDFLESNFKQAVRIKDLIRNHRMKENRGEDKALNALLDADMLDEVGMQSALMCSNWINKDTAYFFKEFEERLFHRELAYINDLIDQVYFQTSKNILIEKKRFIEGLVNQLKIENEGSLSRLDYQAYRAL